MNYPPSAPPSPHLLRWLTWLSPAVLLFSLGCSKMDSGTMGPDEGYYTEAMMPGANTVDVTGDYAYDEDDYDFKADLAEGGGERMAREQMATPPGPPARSPKSKTSTHDASKPKPGSDDHPQHGRQIIYVAGLHISVYDLESGMATVESVPDRFGGWIHMRSENQVVLRLPASKLKLVMAELAEIGVVEARTLQAQDVTAEYVDLESRIKVLRETQTQLLELLAKAKTVEEALHVRRALDEVTMELEVALGRMRQLGDLIAFSTLTITLVERGPQDNIPTSNDPFRWVDELGVEATEWR